MPSDPPHAPIRAVVFDLDGVLTDTAEYHYLAWQDLADAEGLAFDRGANDALRGLSRADSLQRILGDRAVDDEVFEAMMARKNAAYVAHLAEMSPDDLLPGALALVDACRARVDACRARGLAVAIGSSSRNARRVLDALAITGRFDAIADGTSVAAAKPAPDVFLAAASMLDVPPTACVVVEDAAAGVDAAHAAGMVAVGIGPTSRVGHADHVFPTTADVDLDAVVGTRSP